MIPVMIPQRPGERVVICEHYHPGRDCTYTLACYRDTDASYVGALVGGGDWVESAGDAFRADDGREIDVVPALGGNYSLIRRPGTPSLTGPGHPWPYGPWQHELLRNIACIDAYVDHQPGPGPSRLYDQRAMLTMQLVDLAGELGWPAGYNADGPAGYRWVVYVDLPTGQVSWHLADEYLECLFAGQPVGLGPRYAGGWDGHTRDEKARRVAAFLGATDG